MTAQHIHTNWIIVEHTSDTRLPKCKFCQLQHVMWKEIENYRRHKYLQTAPIRWHWLMASHGAITSTRIILSVDGGWTDWSEGTCWGYQRFGYQWKTRTCTNPEPVCGGSACVGRGIEVTPCDPRRGKQKRHLWFPNNKPQFHFRYIRWPDVNFASELCSKQAAETWLQQRSALNYMPIPLLGLFICFQHAFNWDKYYVPTLRFWLLRNIIFLMFIKFR